MSDLAFRSDDSESFARALHELTLSVRRRVWMASIVRCVTWGLMLGAASALAFAIIRAIAFPESHWGWPILITMTGAGIGLAAGCIRGCSESAAARLIDRKYQLKDRSITALAFLGGSDSDQRPGNAKASIAKRLQIQEATAHLANVNAGECVPIDGWDRPLRWAAGLAAGVMLIVLVTPNGTRNVQAGSNFDLGKEQAVELRETLIADVEELVKDQEDPELEELLEELREKVDEMEKQTVDETDLMATLSEMEQALAEARDAMQLEMTDALMKALAEAIEPSEAMQQASKALESEDYEKASEEFKAIDPSKIGDKQRRAVADNLKKMLASLGKANQGQLSDSISQLAEGLDSKNMKECKKCLSKLASQCKKQSNSKKICNCMSTNLNRLSQCKSNCRGQCESNIAKKSNSPSTKAGKASSGQPLGDKATSIDSTRQEQQLTGTQGEGPSETEILQAPEGDQDAVRKFKGDYDKFRREAEAVLDSEPLPMGVREIVRTYFESIRPDNETSSKLDSQ